MHRLLCGLTFLSIWAVLLLSFPPLQGAEEYSFVRMWPNLPQPWYFQAPGGVAVDTSGNVYVADTLNHRIQKFTSEGAFIAKWGKSGTGDAEFDWPWGVAVDPSGNVYVADTRNDRIQKFTWERVFITKWGSEGIGDGQFRYPEGIAADGSGNIYVADRGNERMQRFTSEGAFIAKWGSRGSADAEFIGPRGVALDGSGNVYVVDTSNHRIQKFTSEGAFITKWGKSGSGDGQFNHPYGIAADASGNIYVADSYNDRIQVFRRSFGMRRISGPLQAPLVEWDSETANTYTLWLSPDLLQWIVLPGSIAASDTGVNSWTDDGQHDLGPPSAATQRLYRIERLP